MNNLYFLRFMTRRNTIFFGKYDTNPNTPRALQQIAPRSTSAAITSQMSNIKEKELFHHALPGIIDKLMTSPRLSQQPEVGSWLKKVLEHNLTGGKCSRGLMTMLAYEMLEKPENITEENIKLSKVLAWCIEMLQAYFCMVDDIMDESTTRRGLPCWYLMPNVGMGAINDSILIFSAITEIFEMYFLKTPHFVNLVRLFHEAKLFTSMGQHLDFTMAHHTKQDYSLFTIERYDTIVRYKTSYYTFRLPILLGLTLVKDVDKNIYADIDDISFKLGELFQMQDDYIDCYGDKAITGKAGTDIQEGKCTWLAAIALQRCNEAQGKLFRKHYASKNVEDVAVIKRLYRDLQIPELYKQRENEIHNDILHRAQQLSLGTASAFFIRVIDQLHKRSR